MDALQADARLKDRPDWVYLLREFYEMYRFLPSGGSPKIRAHQRAVREAISRMIRANPQILPRPAEDKPVVQHLTRALDEGERDRLDPAVRALRNLRDALSWQYGYEKVPKGLANSYAYAELCGEGRGLACVVGLCGTLRDHHCRAFKLCRHHSVHEAHQILVRCVPRAQRECERF